MLECQHVASIQYLKHNAKFIWRHWNWQLHHFEDIVEFSFPSRFYFLSINLDYELAEPNIGKILKANIILIMKYLNLNCNVVKSFIFTKKWLILSKNFQKCYWFQMDALCLF